MTLHNFCHNRLGVFFRLSFSDVHESSFWKGIITSKYLMKHILCYQFKNSLLHNKFISTRKNKTKHAKDLWLIPSSVLAMVNICWWAAIFTCGFPSAFPRWISIVIFIFQMETEKIKLLPPDHTASSKPKIELIFHM